MDNAAEMKKLQQQVIVLRTQQQQRTDKVVELLTEAKRVTRIIQPIHQKVR